MSFFVLLSPFALVFRVVLLAVPLLVLALLVYVLVRPVRWADPEGADPDSATAATARRMAITYRIATLVGLFYAAWAWLSLPNLNWVALTDPPGLLAALVPIMAGLLFLAVVAIGESTWPRPRGTTRKANLTHRPAVARAASLPRAAMWLWFGILAAALVVFGLIAAPEGRSMPHPFDPGNPNTSGAAGPFPGWPYGVPILVGAALLVMAALATSHLIARRPAIPGTPAHNDAALRTAAATRVAKGAQLALAVTLAGVLWFASASAGNAGLWWAWATALLGVLTLGGGSVVAVRPARADDPSLAAPPPAVPLAHQASPSAPPSPLSYPAAPSATPSSFGHNAPSAAPEGTA
nr:hypothetical protein [Actinomycetales bacterium]